MSLSDERQYVESTIQNNVRTDKVDVVMQSTEVSIMSILSFILFLVVAAVCAFLAERLVPNNVPGGFLTSPLSAS